MSIKANLRARRRRRRILWVSLVVLVAGLIVVAYFVGESLSVHYSPLKGTPVSTSVLQDLTGVNDTTLSAVGLPTGVSPPASISGGALASGGKPEVLYIGGEFCPYCAIQRWALIVALSHFGTFSGLEFWESSAGDINAMTPTFSFANAT